jgi:putative addiction module component (TIGR02574 family)
MTTQLQELRSLTISERVQLVEDLWDSIAQDASEVALAQDQIDLLDKRLDALARIVHTRFGRRPKSVRT